VCNKGVYLLVIRISVLSKCTVKQYKYTCEVITIAKDELNKKKKKKILFTCNLNLNLRQKLVKCNR